MEQPRIEPGILNLYIIMSSQSQVTVLVVYNEIPMRAPNTTSLKCCLPSTDTIESREKNSRLRMKVNGSLIQVRFIKIHQVFAKKKGRMLL